MSEPGDLGVADASALLAARTLSSVELVAACLARIDERDGAHCHDGDAESINAWVRVYEEDALAAAAAADERLSPRAVKRDGPAPPLCGIPIGLKDLFAVAGKPVTASSRLLYEVPTRHSDVWARLEAAGMVLLGHLHTHEFAAGGTTDQVASPWSRERSAGGSSGGSGAAVAARMVPVATGTDTAGSLRIPSALGGTSTIKPTRGLVSMAGVVPLAATLDHAGPMARSLADCGVVLAAMAGPDRRRPWSALQAQPREALAGAPPASLAGARIAVSPRLTRVELEPDVAEGFDRALEACRALGATLVDAAPADAQLDVDDDFLDVLTTDVLAYHRRFDGRRELYRPSTRGWVEEGERRAVSGESYAAAQARRWELTGAWVDWFASERISALVEPTVPTVAPLRGHGYDQAGSDVALIAFTHYWDWTGLPVAAIPAGTGARTGLPVGVSLIGTAGADWELLSLGAALQGALGVPEPPQ
jgi:aspartyl-tRNA(Asn)/glutamyl-tRNA(Gln) amidotransferase subunit A